MKIVNPSTADIFFNKKNITHHQIGIDTIELMPKYEVFVKKALKMGLTIEPMPKSNNIYKKIAKEIKDDTQKRLKLKVFSPIVERIKLPKVKGRSKAMYITIIRNTPTLFDVATHHKKAKDTYCRVIFAGLHQPTKKVSSEAMKIISQFTKSKTFKVLSIDLAIDTTDYRSITHKRKDAFKEQLAPFANGGVISKGSSLYINNPLGLTRISKILYYDKYIKQINQQKKEQIGKALSSWKRLEVTVSFDVTDKGNKGFTQYIEGFNFIDDLCELDEISKKTGVKSYDTDYLTYQINSLLDNRFMNNHESKEQFNSVESLERFKTSDFRRYILAI